MFINFYDVNSIKTAQTRIIFFKNTAKSKQKFKKITKMGPGKERKKENRIFWVAKPYVIPAVEERNR